MDVAIASWLILSATVPYEASIVSRSFGVSSATTVTPTVFPFSITSVSTGPHVAVPPGAAGSAGDFR